MADLAQAIAMLMKTKQVKPNKTKSLLTKRKA